jgi:hypothetical protein
MTIICVADPWGKSNANIFNFVNVSLPPTTSPTSNFAFNSDNRPFAVSRLMVTVVKFFFKKKRWDEIGC